ncbi:MAG: GNAT family N-acetyltransferase [Bacteroidota bacterium]|nr:GNAT family N-acetyltransferase [Bacteroidota bacterium]
MLEFNFDPFPELETARLTLRRITRKDAEAFFELRTHPDTTKYSDRFPPKSLEEIYAFMDRIEQDISSNQSIAWAISLKGNDEFIGTVNFHRTYPEHHRAEMGYQLLSKYWRQGIMSEAVQAAIDYGFMTMKLHTIEAQVNPNNEASIALLKKAGFVQEAYFRENFYFNGKFLDTPVFTLWNK